jgi:multisubunit Na+/H+ antiporter MnhF subunit
VQSWVGLILIVVANFLSVIRRLDSKSAPYHLLNLCGAGWIIIAGLATYPSQHNAILVFSFVWGIISFVGVVKRPRPVVRRATEPKEMLIFQTAHWQVYLIESQYVGRMLIRHKGGPGDIISTRESLELRSLCTKCSNALSQLYGPSDVCLIFHGKAGADIIPCYLDGKSVCGMYFPASNGEFPNENLGLSVSDEALSGICSSIRALAQCHSSEASQ